ncbi:ABC transporter ATP-binding protein [Rhodophyticola sp. CCM32]|uniref:ABC transporter ATP-binding protein n=1 Tax=Rhodophyticola sp. CCM32 TaxID=2916397 RepID=UPI001EE63473|nr:ABC transporter ATP-binding protein [Rhodophyticola sp. CCM32]
MSGGLQLKNVSKSFGALTVLNDINITVETGEFLVLLGESGCGKSTLLRLISGLEEDHEGAIEIGGRDVTHLDPKNRDLAMVFQSYALYPHMSVFDNIAFGMRIRKSARADIKTEVERVAQVLKLEDYLQRKPAQLSGGQRQRVAIGRAMVRNPQLFLFDEPLSNLDAKLRTEMRTELKRIHKTLNATIAYVTHDQVEAMTLADKIVLLNKGRIEQLGTPEELYLHPDTLFAAQFIGSPEINALDVTIATNAEGFVAHFGDMELPLPASVARGKVQDGQRATLAIRPENLSLAAEGATGTVTGPHSLEFCEPIGSETSMVIDIAGTHVRMREPGLLKLATGSNHNVIWDLAAAHLFDPDSGRHL